METTAEDDEFAVVECILDTRTGADGTIEYLVKWEGDASETAWIPEEDAVGFDLLMAEFNKRKDLESGPGSNPGSGPEQSEQQGLESADGGDRKEGRGGKPRKRPVKVAAKQVERNGKVVYSVFWDDSSRSEESANSITDKVLESLIEEYENAEAAGSTSSRSSRSSQSLAHTNTRSGTTITDNPTANETESVQTTRRTSSRNTGIKVDLRNQAAPEKGFSSTRSGKKIGKEVESAAATQLRKRKHVIEDSDEEFDGDASDSEDEEQVDELALDNDDEDEDGYRKERRNRRQGGTGKRREDLDVEDEEEASDINSEDDEEEEEDVDFEGEADESVGRNLDRRNNGLTTHHDFCLRCGAGDENKPKKGRAKKDADLIGSVGELLPCATCSASCHEKCRIKPNKKDRERYSARAQELGFFIDVYQCPDCFPLTLPPCNICNLPVMHAEGAEAPGPAAAQADPAAGVADAPAPAPVLAQQARILGTEDVTPLFRCSRCKLPAHLSCLVKTYPAAAYKAIDEQPSSRRVLASPEFYTGHWTCFECWKWPKTVDSILTFRDLALSAPTEEMLVDGKPDTVTREYYVKFVDVSHRWNEWVPARWVEGQRECQGKLGVFLRERVNAWQALTVGVRAQPGGAKAKPVDAVVNPDFLRAERVLDVQVKRAKHSGVDGKRAGDIERLNLDRDIESVYVKWLGLPYDASTWEQVPVNELPPEGLNEDEAYKRKVDVEMYPSFVEAFDEYKKRNMIGSIGEEKPCTRDPNFYEFESQPDYIVGGSLKDYQIDGLNWLVYQWFNTQGCILADEMGLGKTLQIVSFLSTLYTGNNYFPFLILAPSITIGHWLDEFHKWAPNMVVVHYTGSKTDRQMIREYEIFRPKSSSSTLRYRFHVLLSSYESMMQESQLFKEIPFAVLVCDEGHRLKNDESRTFRQLMNNITVQHKVVLSGTPLQNNMREMFNLLNFLDPEQYSDPKDLASKFGIENIKSDDTIIPKIHKFLRPLFLRRTKKEVLTFLPPKAEILVPCPLTPVQRELYKAVLAKNFDLLRSIGVQSGQTETKAVPLKNILMELRKICNHPYLGSSNLEPPDTSAADLHKLMVDASGKFSLLQPMLRKLHTRGHRVLIFSQFKIVLDIVEDFLNGENYEYLRIDGETPTSQRHSMINSFNSTDSKHFVFLLTTRTGGTGINLTSADTVIIYDSDWNPHQDIQAVARVHRIGQTKPVLIYKLFTRDTVESSIIERSTSKLVLDKIVVGALDEENVDTKELSSILKVGARKLFEESGDQESSALKFDDAAVERLIDRDRIIEEEQEKEKAMTSARAASKNTDDAAGADGNEDVAKPSFSFAKVWILDAEAAAAEKAKEDDVMETEEQGEDESDENFWERLLQGRIETAAQNFNDSMILGKRRRVAVNYREARRNRPDIQLELEADDVSDEYAPEEDSAQESASDASEMEDDQLEFKGLSGNVGTQWIPWKTFSNRLDPFKARPYPPSESQRIAKCWLCLKQSCRYREHCEKAADANFLKTLLDGLTSVINRPTKPNTDLSSLRFKIRIVTRLLAHAMTMPHTNLIQQKSHTGSDSLVHPRNRMAGQAAPAGLPRQSQSFLALKHVVPAANVKLDEKTLKKLRDFNVQLQELREMLQKGASPLNSNAPAAGAANAADVIDLSESLTLPAVPVPVPAVVLTSGPAPALAASSPLPAPTIASSSGSSIPVNSPFAKVPTTAPPSIPSQSALSTTAAIKPVHPPPPSIASPQIQRRQSDVLSPVNPSSAMSETPLSVQTARTPVASLGQRVMASNSPTLSRPLSANQLNPQLLNNFASPTLAHTSVSLRGNAPQQFVQAQQAQFVQQPNYQIQQQLSQNMGNFAIPSHQQVLPQQQQQPLFAAPSPSQFQPQFAQTPQSYQQQFQQQTLQPQYGQIPPSQVQGLPNLQASYSLSNPQTISHLPLLQQAQPSQAMPVNLQNLSQHPLLQPPISMFGGTSSSSSSSSNSGFLDPVCWFCGQTGHTAESCVKVHPQTIDTTCFEYLEAYFKSGKLPANRYEALRALAHSRLEQKQRLAREAAAV